MHSHDSRGTCSWPEWAVCVLLSAGLAATGCSDLTQVDAPDVVTPGQLDDSAGAQARRAGAIGTFATAFAGQALYSGLLADEFADRSLVHGSADGRAIPADQDSDYPYGGLSLARVSAIRAITSLEAYSPDPAAAIGELFALKGYVELFFAENMCSGVPLAEVTGGIPLAGVPRSRDELLTLALAGFDSAAVFGAADPATLNLARVGRARTLLFKGDLPAASAAAADVPLAFAYQVAFSAASAQGNTIYANIAVQLAMSVADAEGLNGLPFVTAADTRLVTSHIGPGVQNGEVFNFSADSSLDAPITLASGIEARLIRAEAALAAGDVGGWANALNELRGQAISPAIPALSADSTTGATAVARVDVHFRERGFWLFGHGHRLGDLRRLVRQYGRNVESVFPTGPYLGGPGLYGPDVAFVPFGEQTNANFSGCTDRAP